jgi:hypothetical protein
VARGGRPLAIDLAVDGLERLPPISTMSYISPSRSTKPQALERSNFAARQPWSRSVPAGTWAEPFRLMDAPDSSECAVHIERFRPTKIHRAAAHADREDEPELGTRRALNPLA